MMNLRIPIIAAVIGEGGSGGALGIGVADRVLILENAYYSVISPEACSAILWRDRRHAAEAAEADDRIVSVLRSEEHTSELQSPDHLVCRLLLEKKNKIIIS